MTGSPVLRRALVGLSALFLLAGVLAAAIVGGGDEKPVDTVAADAGSTTTTAGVPAGGGDAPVTTAAGGGPNTTVKAGSASPVATAASGGGSAPASTAPPTTAGSTNTPVAASGFADLGPASSGGVVVVPKAGLYRYTFKGPERQGEASTRIEDRGEASGARKLLVTITGQGFDSTNDVAWGSGEVRVAKSTFAFGQQKGECDWEPDHLQMKLPLAPGATWDSASTCSVSGFGPTPIVIKRTTTAKVTEARRVRVAGEEIDVWVITGTEKLETPQGGGESTTTTWFSGAHGVVVRQTSTTPNGDVELEIRNLKPE